MFETVLVVAVWAAHARIFECVYEGLAGDVIALVAVVYVGFHWRGAVFLGWSVSSSCPFALARAFVGGFGAVVEAEGTMAGFAAEGQEVELATVFELAVAADGFEVLVGHLGEGLLLLWRSAPFRY